MDDPFDLPPDVLRRIPLFRELSKVLAWSGGPVNWDLARQIAMSVAAETGVTNASSGAEEIVENVRLAELWLAETMTLPANAMTSARPVAPIDWAEHASVALGELIDPIAAKLQRAMDDVKADPADPIAGAIGQLAPMFMGMQAGTIIGELAKDITGTHELGFPVGEGDLVLVVSSIDAHAAARGVDVRAARQWVALVAAAHRALCESFPLVRAQFFASYHDYVSSLDVDIAEGMAKLQSLDFTDPSRLQEMLGEHSLFTPQASPGTAKAAERVVRLLALIDAHVHAAAAFAGVRLGDVTRTSVAFAGGSKGAQLLDSFIGLERGHDQLRARAFAGDVIARGGWEALNGMWDEPDALPSDAELSDATSWLARVRP